MPLASPLLFFLFDFLCQTQQTPYAKKRKAFGTAGGTRTPDLLVRSQSLYPAELLPLVCLRVSLTAFVYYHTFLRIASLFFNFFRFFDFSLASPLKEPKTRAKSGVAEATPPRRLRRFLWYPTQQPQPQSQPQLLLLLPQPQPQLLLLQPQPQELPPVPQPQQQMRMRMRMIHRQPLPPQPLFQHIN